MQGTASTPGGIKLGRRSWVVVIVLILVTVIVAAPAFALVEKSGFPHDRKGARDYTPSFRARPVILAGP